MTCWLMRDHVTLFGAPRMRHLDLHNYVERESRYDAGVVPRGEATWRLTLQRVNPCDVLVREGRDEGILMWCFYLHAYNA